MSWMGGLGWKEGLSGVQMQKVTKSSMIFLIKIIRVWWSTISPQMRTWKEFMSNTIFSYQAVQSKISPSPPPSRQFLIFLLFQVEELEKSLSRAQGASQQKQQQLDSLNQGIEKLKRKVRRIRLHRCPLVPVRLWRVGLFDFGSGSGRVWPKSLGFGFGFEYCAYYSLKANSLVILCYSILGI